MKDEDIDLSESPEIFGFGVICLRQAKDRE
jgi:hypothetical protein